MPHAKSPPGLRRERGPLPLGFFALAVLSLPAGAQERAEEGKEAPPRILARVDPRVELMSLIFRLAGHPEYNKGRVPSYTKAVEEHFGGFRDHPVVRRARELRRRRGIGFDACMSLAVHLKEASKLEEALPFDPFPETLDRRWTTKEARAFLEDARDFVKKTRFQAFFSGHRDLFATAASRMQEVLEKDARLPWFEEFFGMMPKVSFELILGMLNGGMCYGPRLRLGDGSERVYCVLGVWSTDRKGLPRFDASMLATVVHEFCHSFVNPLVDAHLRELEEPGRKIWPGVAEAMRFQAYGGWEIMMRESLVRACVVRYLAATGGEAARSRQILEERLRHFRWVGGLSDALGEYEKEREKYPTLDAFFPRIVAFFQGYARELARQGPEVPKVLSLSPRNGAQGVDPKTAEIRIVFDRPMRDRSWSFVGGGPSFPKVTGEPAFDETRRILVLPVKLEPGRTYEFRLNSPRNTGFRSEKGIPLEPLRVTFRTGS